jgi:hypothetical protein
LLKSGRPTSSSYLADDLGWTGLSDIGQKQNLAVKMAQKTKELHDQMVTWRKWIKAAMPTAK